MANKKVNNSSFTETEINAVWEKGTPIYGEDSRVYRKDKCGAKIKRNEYGNTSAVNGK